jgi:peptidoglycan/xylan/chitin deacetylase (PgdA/CDA1 family)
MAFAAKPALAVDCPGHPDAIGTSRTIVVDPREHPRIGVMQYGETLPLRDHEVVLTFDDGPIPHNSNQILEILASQCVKATFFTVGRMAQAYPEGVRRLRDAGHTIGTHTQNHPVGFKRLPIDRAKQEIDDAIAATGAALRDPSGVAPFFRNPGLSSAEAVEELLALEGVQVWSADFPADDWRNVSSARVAELAISRLEAKGKGILLLHDIQARTVAALPTILREMKARGYRIVHVVPATKDLPRTPTEPQQWQTHPVSETVAISHWPKVPNFVYSSAAMLPGPVLSESNFHDGEPLALPENFKHSRRLPRGAVPLPEQAPWPRQSLLQQLDGAISLPVPAQSVFQIPEREHAAAISIATPLARRAELAPPVAATEASAMARMMSVNAGALRRRIPGSMPVAESRLQRGPVMAR